MDWDKKQVLVTGGAGFVGSHLVELLVAAGARVTVVDDLSTGRRENLSAVPGKIELKVLDIRESIWGPIFSHNQYDVIFHLAGNAYVPPSVEHPEWDYQVNLDGTFTLLEILRLIKWPGALIYASSAAVYGNPVRIPIREDDPTVPISPYGVGKLAAERYTAVYSQLYGIRTASLRFFSLYGPRQRKQVVFDLIQRISKRPDKLNIYGDGTQVRDFNFVEDTARAMMLVAEGSPLKGEVYNVASGREYSINELAELLCKINNIHPQFIYTGSVRPGDPEKWSVDISSLAGLGYQPQVTLEDGLMRTVKWYLSTLSM